MNVVNIGTPNFILINTSISCPNMKVKNMVIIANLRYFLSSNLNKLFNEDNLLPIIPSKLNNGYNNNKLPITVKRIIDLPCDDPSKKG